MSFDSAAGIPPDKQMRLELARSFMEREFRRRPTMYEVAPWARYDRSKFTVRFKQLFGVPPATYMREFAYRHVRDRLLQCSPAERTKLILASGYVDVHHFWRTFRRHEGSGFRQWAKGVEDAGQTFRTGTKKDRECRRQGDATIREQVHAERVRRTA
jgi:transcriptional regulator GlxA family with amidase domain